MNMSWYLNLHYSKNNWKHLHKPDGTSLIYKPEDNTHIYNIHKVSFSNLKSKSVTLYVYTYPAQTEILQYNDQITDIMLTDVI